MEGCSQITGEMSNPEIKVENTRETLSKWNEKGSTKDVEIK